jgi:hypothetical protein
MYSDEKGEHTTIVLNWDDGSAKGLITEFQVALLTIICSSGEKSYFTVATANPES